MPIDGVGGMDDEALFRRYRDGVREAFEELFRRYHRRLLRFVQSLGAGPHESEDVAIETFMRVHARAETFEPDPRCTNPFRAWLYTIARRRWCSFLRVRGRLPAFVDTVPEDRRGPRSAPPAEPPDEAAANDDLRKLRECLEQLAPGLRAVMRLVSQGFSAYEITLVLEFAVSTVERRKTTAKALLRRCMERRP